MRLDETFLLCHIGSSRMLPPASEIKLVCPEQRGMSVLAPSPDLNSHKFFTSRVCLLDPFCIRVSAVPCAKDVKMYAASPMYVLVASCCHVAFLNNLNLALKYGASPHSAEQGALQRREAFATSEGLLIYIITVFLTV